MTDYGYPKSKSARRGNTRPKLDKIPKKMPQLVSEDTLWKNFSHYIRLRDSIERGDGVNVSCFTCNFVGSWKYNMQCGHFVKRSHWGTKYDEQNNHAQCIKCNKYLNGNEGAYAIALDLKYGEGTALELKSRKGGEKLTKMEMAVLNKELKDKIKKLEKNL